MKKVLMSTAVLLMLSAGIFFFQMSCTKSSEASPSPQEDNVDTLVIIKRDTVWMHESGYIQQQNKVIYIKEDKGGGVTPWISDFDGENKKKLNVSLPTDLGMSEIRVALDGKHVFFVAYSNDGKHKEFLYKGTLEKSSVKDLTIVDTNGESSHSDGEILSLWPF